MDSWSSEQVDVSECSWITNVIFLALTIRCGDLEYEIARQSAHEQDL